MTVTDIYRALWRHKLLVGVLTLLVVGATAFLTSRQTKIYQASTVVRIQQPTRNAVPSLEALNVGHRLAQTYSNILNTDQVARRVREAAGGDLPLSAIKGQMSARPLQELDVLVISARSASPRDARRIANAVPHALTEFVRTTSARPAEIVTLDAARLPRTPVSPDLMLNLTIAFLLGLMLNGALALLLELLADRLPDADELASVVGVPVLATIPRLSFTRVASLNGAGGKELEADVLDSLARSSPGVEPSRPEGSSRG